MKNQHYKINIKNNNSNKLFKKFRFSKNTKKVRKISCFLHFKKLFCLHIKGNCFCIKINKKISFKQVSKKIKRFKLYKIYLFSINTLTNSKNNSTMLFQKSFY